MSRIDDLLAECPVGLEFRTVSATVRNVVAPHKIKREHYGLGTKYAIVDQSQAFVAGYTDDKAVLVPGGRYVVFGDHTRAVKYVDFRFAQGADGLKILCAVDDVMPRFLYFAILNLDIPSRGYNRHWPILKDLLIPVPRIEMQQEIVTILDTFTDLESKLGAELEARRRQYHYYRDSLLAFPEQGEVRRMPMGEIGEFIRGRRFTKDDVVSDGVGSIHYGEIYTRYGVYADRALSHVRAELAPNLRFAKTGDVVIAAVGETVEDVCKAVAWLGKDDVAIHDDCFAYRHSLNPKFVSHYFQTRVFHADKNKYVARAKVKRISGESLAKLEIPVPPLEEQERIVEILDKFDALVNDLSVGLPAELRARRQQYEYYRDRLLTFDRVAA